jgi:hypothetical protein
MLFNDSVGNQMKDSVDYLDYAIAHTVSTDPNHWYCWVRDVEKDLGHSLEGDLATDGYSKNEAFMAWRNGYSVLGYASRVRSAKHALWRAELNQKIKGFLRAVVQAFRSPAVEHIARAAKDRK